MKIAVGMSGGVDSSVCAYLLQKEGYEVTGVTIRTRKENTGDHCNPENEIEDAGKVCKALGIEHVVIDGTECFKEKVMDYFAYTYAQGKTPNPCIICNRELKLALLYAFVASNGFDRIATGHYARVGEENGRFFITKALHDEKDQSYALYRLSQEQLSKLVLPLGCLSKPEIRQIAASNGLITAQKKESMDICFVPDGDYSRFIKENYPDIVAKPGNFTDVNGKVLGKHEGIINYTVGQRRGLGIALGERTFVKEIKAESNEVVLSNDADLFSKEVFAGNVVFQAIDGIKGFLPVNAKIRYNHKGASGVAELMPDNKIHLIFDEPQRAVTKGQALVLYNGDAVLCGGEIENTGLGKSPVQ